MSKTRVDDLDQAICRGTHPDVETPCPHLVNGQDETGRTVVDRLARLETKALEAATGAEQFKCEHCGCPLANLEKVNLVPDACPRLQIHDK
ncbi:hypothetical protein EKH57_17600 (plasmid) [Halorubrum sp. BOL3-1]|nr:hypothetical protein EKH57_17600 [Halorubrum sp. BOL3-1]